MNEVPDMLKEVGSSGQISLGKRFAGQLFEMVIHPDGRVELIPMKLVAAARSSRPAKAAQADWLPPGGYAQANAWALANREALESYADAMAREGTAAEQLQRYLQDTEDSAG
ncbi:hypothetical protein [Ottowia sp.]|uniref:hypothetical protein n=1 Tax=Ottowia sp. TaxID=1898956 RepID=UPI0039E672D8